MHFMQNLPRNEHLTRAEKHMVNLQAQEFDNFKVMETFNKVPDRKKDELYLFKM